MRSSTIRLEKPRISRATVRACGRLLQLDKLRAAGGVPTARVSVGAPQSADAPASASTDKGLLATARTAPVSIRVDLTPSVSQPTPTLVPGAVPALDSGWICYAWWTNDTRSPITSFETEWTVPPAPASTGTQTVFPFNGIDPINASDGILQPVCSEVNRLLGGGPSWAVASWYVAGDGRAYHSELVPVSPGDRLKARMVLASVGADGLFSYKCEFMGIAGTQLAGE